MVGCELGGAVHREDSRRLAEGGSIWLLTPKVGRDGYVSGADIGEAAPVAGLSTTTTSSATADWAATKLSTHKR